MSEYDDSFPTSNASEEETGLREELVTLAETGEIKNTPKYIKKASQDALEKIKRDYDRKQTEEANEFISNNLISKFTELMDNLNMVEDTVEMEKELTENQLLKRDRKNIVDHITPYIPLIGLDRWKTDVQGKEIHHDGFSSI